jgi:hypothetical protein
MVLKREQFNLERIGTKNTIKVLRFLTSKPYLSFGLTELSKDIKISRDEVEDGSTLNPWRHGFGNLGIGGNIAWISEKRPLFFFGVAGAVFTIIGLIFGANVLYVANAGGGVAVGSALVSVLFIVIGVFSVFTGLILNEIAKGKEKE